MLFESDSSGVWLTPNEAVRLANGALVLGDEQLAKAAIQSFYKLYGDRETALSILGTSSARMPSVYLRGPVTDDLRWQLHTSLTTGLTVEESQLRLEMNTAELDINTTSSPIDIPFETVQLLPVS